jgi:ribosomal-protein-alanine N-acetyltransferase
MTMRETALFPPIETARLILRCVESEDVAAMAALITPAVSQSVARWPYPFTSDMASTRIADARAAAAAGDELPFALVEKSLGAMIGWLVIHRHAEERSRGSFGYWLGEAWHGQGYMREAAPPALDCGFTLLELDVIEAGAQLDNAASFAIMRACGMNPVGDRMSPAPARGRDELCRFYELRRQPHHGNTAFPAPGTNG